MIRIKLDEIKVNNYDLAMQICQKMGNGDNIDVEAKPIEKVLEGGYKLRIGAILTFYERA